MTPEQPPLRLIEEESDALERRLGGLIRQLGEPAPLAPGELAQVRSRLVPRASRPLHEWLRYALLLAFGISAGTGVALASFGVRRWLEQPPSDRSAPPNPSAGAAMPSVMPRLRRGAPVVSVTAAPSVEMPLVPAPDVPVGPRPSSDGAGELARESQLLATALARLRSSGDPKGALALLDRYRHEFPDGALELESEVARLDAYLALGRDVDALRLLDALPIDRIGRGPELRVVRAELRARRDPMRAVSDFDAALRLPLPVSLEERALFGRAASRLQSGDRAGAALDFRSYLARHPGGRFAAEARAHIAEP